MQVQGALLLFDHFSHTSHNGIMSLAPSEKQGIFACYGKFSERRKLPFYCLFARFELSSSHFDGEAMSSLINFRVILECIAWRTVDCKATHGDFGR